MNYILDTNIAFEILLNGPKAQKYRKLLEDAESVIAPCLFKSEVTNVLWQYVKAGYFDEENANKLLISIFELVNYYVEPEENAIESLHEAIRLNHSAYDMYYFTLARRFGATLLTLDKKLAEVAKKNGIKVG